jgi:FtsP/CotA-like multicopper oxidase with cupredoxin domain
MRSLGVSIAATVFALLAVTAISLTAPSEAISSPLAAQRNDCGALSVSRDVVEPPNVDVSALPVDADGLHELIMAVHKSGGIFCYRYRWNDAEQTVAPAIRVHRGDRFALRIVNDISSQSAGERVSSSSIPPCKPMPMPPAPLRQFAGYLNHTIDDRYMKASSKDTNFHLHGFIGPPSEENIFLSTLSTPMHACEYRIAIPASQPPGTYFYHPHAHGAADAQVASGLSGVWIVEPDTPPQLPRSAEHVLLIKYRQPVLLDNRFAPDDSASGDLAAAREAALPLGSPVPYDPFNPPPWPVTFPMKFGTISEDAGGCDGLDSEALTVVDGSETPARLAVAPGQTQLLRIVNATADSPKLLQLRDAGGKILRMQVVARDGTPFNGDAAKPLSGYVAMDQVMLAPFARADVLVSVAEGQRLELSTEHFCDGTDAFYQMHHTVVRIEADPALAKSGETFASSPVNVADTPAANLLAYARAHPGKVKRRAITFTEYVLPASGKIPEHPGYYITDTTDPHFREHPIWPQYAAGATVPSNADVVVKSGTIEEWYLINATMESHVFHIHQMSFVVEKGFSSGEPLTVDSAFVPVGSFLPNPKDPNYPLIRPRITKVLLDFRQVPRGTFVFHCHMLFHEDAGMMGIVRVE